MQLKLPTSGARVGEDGFLTRLRMGVQIKHVIKSDRCPACEYGKKTSLLDSTAPYNRNMPLRRRIGRAE